MRVFHWSRPYSRTYDSMVSCKSRGQKSIKKGGKKLGRFHLPDRTWNIQACLALEADLPWGRDILYRTSLETTRTSPKPLRDNRHILVALKNVCVKWDS